MQKLIVVIVLLVGAAGTHAIAQEEATAPKDMTKAEWVKMEKSKWEESGWPWNQAKVEANFDEMDTNKDGVASGKERADWFAKKKAEKAAEKAAK